MGRTPRDAQLALAQRVAMHRNHRCFSALTKNLRGQGSEK